jgi:hypothetical protein
LFRFIFHGVITTSCPDLMPQITGFASEPWLVWIKLMFCNLNQ